MKRSILAVIAGLAIWIVVVSVLNRGLRLTLAGYTAAEPTMNFTLTMMLARLTIAVLTSLAAGAVVGWIAPLKRPVPWVLGALLLAAFVPTHIALWAKFPVWYHLFFLVTLAPLIAMGASLTRNRLQPALHG